MTLYQKGKLISYIYTVLFKSVAGDEDLHMYSIRLHISEQRSEEHSFHRGREIIDIVMNQASPTSKLDCFELQKLHDTCNPRMSFYSVFTYFFTNTDCFSADLFSLSITM